MKIKEKFFCGEIVRDLEELKRKRKRWRELPRFTDFGEETARESVFQNAEGALVKYFQNELSKGVVVYDKDDMRAEAVRRKDALSEDERNELLERIAKEKADKLVHDTIQRNFRKVQMDVRGIIERECYMSQDITPPRYSEPDYRMTDPFAEG